MIPKKIFYIWFGNKPLPSDLKKYIKGWEKLNPDFSIECINEKNFDISKYKFTQDAYDDKKWAFVSDLARLDVIYNKGGFYLDTDVELRKPLTSLLNYKSVWALENSDSIASGLIIGAEPKNKNLERIINLYKDIDYKNTSEEDLVTVKIVTNYFLQHGFKIKNKNQLLSDGTLILSSDYFAPFHFWGGGHITKRTIGVHKYMGSWINLKNLSKKYKINRECMLLFPTVYVKIREIYRKVKNNYRK